MDLLRQDLRYGLRRLATSPLFTIVAILSLAAGIGANAAIFSIVNAVLLRPLPVAEPDRLVEVYTNDDDTIEHAVSSYPDYLELKRATNIFEGVIAYELFLPRVGQSENATVGIGELVTGNYFDMLGVRAAKGRTFLPEEDATPGTHAVLVLGNGYWRRMLGGDPNIVGATIWLNRRPFTVIGVMPAEFHGMYRGIEPDFWAPMMMVNQLMPVAEDRLLARGNRSLMLKARLGPGITIEQARAAASTISQRLATDYPDTNKDRAFSMLPTRDVAIHPLVDRVLVPVAFLLLAAVALVLVIACTNLAGFLLARALDRRKEIAVRLALGAKRIQLVRQLIVESLILALLGGAAGVLVAHFTLNLLMRFQPPLPIPLRLDVGLDERVFVFTLVVSVVAGLAFGLVPGLQGTRAQVMPVLRDEAGATGTRRRRGVRDVLVIMQVAVSVLLLIGSGLFVRSLQKAQAVDPGFDTGPAAILWPNFQLSGFDEARGRLMLDALVQRLRSSPGVSAVGVADRLPLGAAIMTQDFSLDGAEPPPGQDAFHIDYTHVDAGYFEALRVPLVAGRNFTAADGPDAPRVAIVSEATVRRFWPEGEAVGRLFYLRGQRDAPVTVIGVVRDTKVRTLGESARPYVYLSVNQQYLDAVQLVVRGTGTSVQLLANARRTVLEVDPQLVLFEAKTMEDHLSLLLYPPRMAALLLSVFGGLALLLSAVGLYGVVSYAVARRTREVGVRMALGATRRDVLSLMLQGGLRLVGAGAAVGLVLAAALTWSIAGFLFGVRATDLVTFAAVPLLLGFVGLLASWVPARRASSIDPLAALRAD